MFWQSSRMTTRYRILDTVDANLTYTRTRPLFLLNKRWYVTPLEVECQTRAIFYHS